MKTYYECIPCFINQTLRVLKGKDKAHHEKVLKDVLHLLGDTDFADSPPEISRSVLDIFERYYGEFDSYADIKKNSNLYIMGLYDDLFKMVSNSSDPFDTAMRLAMAGNVIDFGANHTFTNKTIHDDIEKVLSAKDITSELLKYEVQKAEKILYIGDNAGEIVFDKLFLSQFPKDKVTFSVRGKPILNDVLMEDAQMVGLADMMKVVSNGSGLPGTLLSSCSSEFRDIFDEADLIISKGQGNYETLSEVDKNIFFLLKIKCPVIARDLGCELNSFLVRQREHTDHDDGIRQ